MATWVRLFLSKVFVGLSIVALSGAVITDDSYFYGQSPPSYPAPDGNGLGDWSDAFSKALALVGQMTLEEKVSLTAGTGSGTSCVGFVPGISRLGVPGICLGDAGQGLRVRWLFYTAMNRISAARCKCIYVRSLHKSLRDKPNLSVLIHQSIT